MRLSPARCFAMLLLCFSATLFASDRKYTVTSADGVVLAVQESGAPQGQPIIFIHGLLGSHLNWEKQRQDPALQRFRLISFDLRGHGLSAKPTQTEAYRQGSRWAEDVAAVITASHAKKPLLVGWSLGGAVISHYLARFGDKSLSGALYVDAVVELTPAQIPAHAQVYAAMTSADLATHLDGERDFLRLCFYQQPDAVTFARLQASAAMASWEMQRAVPLMQVALEKGLGKATIPVQFIYGKHDQLVNPQASLARARNVNPRISAVWFANSGHAPFLEEPARFNQQLADFADSLR
ncbi:alpha/beta hydrolase [Kosakonia sp. BK9b]